MSRFSSALAAAALFLASLGAAHAKTLKYASNTPLPTLDGHAKTDNTTLSFVLNIYETLVRRDEKLELEPALAVSWSNVSPTIYRFNLRPNVKWHDGTDFTADDVVFSFKRASHLRSEARVQLVPIKEVRKVDALTVEIETKWPDPLLVERTYGVLIFQKAWSERNGAVDPVDMNASGTSNAAQHKAMGTGPFMLKSHDPNSASVAVVNPTWWDKPRHNLTEVSYFSIPNAGSRTAALLSGQIDLNYSLPVQHIDTVREKAGYKVVAGPEIRTIFLALDQHRDELLESNVKGKNPFKDARVRKAIYQAIDIESIRTRIMRDQAQPTALMWAPGVNGYSKELDVRLSFDPEVSKKLLVEAGYPNGFEVGFDCPNDRYLNDEATCLAVTGMLARIGIKARLNALPRNRWFAKLLPDYKISMTLAGWFPIGVYDAAHTLNGVLACRSREKNRGVFNLGGYCSPKVDSLIEQSERELDRDKRRAMLVEIARIHRDEIGHIPLHHTFIAWGMKSDVDVAQTADNIFLWRYVKVR